MNHFMHPTSRPRELKDCRRAPRSNRENVPTLRVANAALLRRLRGVSWRQPRTGKSVLCTRRSSRSFGSPSGFHRCGKLRTTFRCEVELSLWFLGSAWFCRGSRRFTLSPSRGPCFCCFKLAFQLGQFVSAFLQASFEPSDLFLETFLLFHMR